MPRRLVFRDLREFRSLYWQHWPEARMAKRLRVDRDVVRRIIKEQGLAPRDYFASNRFLAEERTLAQRQAMTAAARAARWRKGRAPTTVS